MGLDGIGRGVVDFFPTHPNMDTLLIVTDLGRMRCWRLRRDPDQPELSPTFETVADESLETSHSYYADRNTDQGGRFASRAASGNPASPGMSTGERHGEEEQAEKDGILQLAEVIARVVEGSPGLPVYFAAPQAIHRRLFDLLPGGVTGRIRKDLALDLTKAEKLDLLRRFEG